MKQNVGSIDRIIRLIVGIVIIVVGAILNSWWGLIGILIFLTGLLGWCGLYRIFGISTCKIKTQQPEEPPKKE
jgi:hypothetical protein